MPRAPFTPSRRRRGRLVAALILALLLGAPATASAADPALVAAYGFDEGSGLSASDASGRGNVGAISGATWTGTGRFGGALSFDGFDDLVTVTDSDSLDLNRMTLEAWVRPTELGRYRAALIKEGATALVYALYSETTRAQPWYQLHLSGETRLRAVNGPTQVPANTWSHLAATYDGLVMRLYVNGTQVATLGRSGTVNASTGAFRIGGTFLGSEFYKGDIDEVRLYNRALTAAEIQTDMNTAVAGSPDTTPPTTPLNFLAGTSGPTTIPVSWTASIDDRGVDHYRMYLNGQPAGTTTSTSFTFAGLTCSTSYTLGVEARDAAGNTSGRATRTAQTAACDTTDPEVSLTAPSAGAEVSGTTSVAATATDNDAVAGVQFLLDGQPLGSEDTSAPYFMSWNTRTVENGTHVITARARDRSGNQRVSEPVSFTVANSSTAFEGLVVGMGFEEGSGASAGDASGHNNHGAITGAAWTPNGRIGSALDFDGVDDKILIPDADSLDLTSGLTLSAWVRPDTLNGKWRTVLFKHRTTNPVYALYAQERDPVPAGEITIGTSTSPAKLQGATQLPLSTWTYLAYTFDGSMQRMYLNGNLVSNVARTGSMLASTGELGIGGNTVWDEAFDGMIDEVRVYNRALPEAEIQADMATSVAEPDSEDPTAPTGLTATGSMGRVTLSWTAATDNVGVTSYNVHRSTTPAFTPSVANRIGQPTSTGYTDSGLVPGTYYYKVTAADRAGNIGPPSNEASGTSTADTVNPTASVTAPANGSTLSGTVNVTANASDNDSVAGVQFLLDGQPLGSEDTTAPYSVSWNSRLGTDGPHVLAARARDASSNSATSADVSVTVDNTAAPPPGLVAGYGFDEGTGNSAADASGNNNNGTVDGASWAPIGHNGGALRFDGLNDMVSVPDSNTLDVTRVTVSAWVKPDLIGTAWRTVMFKERTDIKAVSYGIYANTNTSQPAGELSTTTPLALKAGTKLPDGVWTHLTMTYDGAAMKLFVDGVQVGSANRTGNLFVSNGAFRIGGNSIWAGEFFNGLIDEVRVYDRALAQAEIEADMRLGVARDTKAPTVVDVTPNAGATGVNPGPTITATFSEAMDPATITAQTFALRDPANTVVPASVVYDATNGTATLRPNAALRYGTQYTVTIEGGAAGTRAKDMAGNALAADHQWAFTTEPTPPPILVVKSSASPNDKFSGYISEILRAEGINGFSENDVSLLGSEYLANFDVVVLGSIPITDAQATALAGWVNAGGNLIASRPDKKLAGLLGLTDQGTTLSNGWMKVDTASAPGAGIVGETIQYHSTADRYALNGARALATLYSDDSTATASPAVSLRDVGASGGQAAAFTFDIARSIAQTRQGNPAWEAQNRDGITEIRTNDLFYGPMVGDPQPNWVQLSKIHIPYADELQRLLANMITEMNRDRTPVPRFWYLPRGEKAAVVMTGDDHADGGTAGRFNQYKAASPAGCSVANWECVRSTSYVYPASPITNNQAASFQAEGFEVALHPSDGGCGNFTFEEYDNLYTVRLNSFAASYPSVTRPITSRFHCVSWSDYDSHAKVQVLHGIRLDTNYYHYHESWANFPGFMTGSGMIQKFTDRNGATLSLYQAATQMQDEPSTPQPYPATINSLLDNALGSNGYYGMFVANMHTDDVDSDGSDAIVASAQARDVPIISSRQALDWVEGRDASAFKDFTWSGGNLGFTVTVGPGANGLQGMLPMQSSAGTLLSVTRDGSAVTPTVRVVKGVQYAVFTAANGTYQAHYGS